MKFVIYSNILFDLEMEIFTENWYKTICLSINGEVERSSNQIQSVKSYLYKKFDYLYCVNNGYKKEIKEFFLNFEKECDINTIISKYMNRISQSLIWFANHYKDKGLLDYNNFQIDMFEIQFSNFVSCPITFDEEKMLYIKCRAASYRGEMSGSFEEDVYTNVVYNLNKLFKKLEPYNTNTIKYKFITITKKEDV